MLKKDITTATVNLVFNNGNYDGELAKEHEELTREICGMIKQEIPEWETKWKNIEC